MGRLAVIPLIGVFAVQAPVGQDTDVSGVWSSVRVLVLRNAHATARGWDQTAENLRGARTYVLAITQTSSDVIRVFPGGSKSIMTTAAFLRDAMPRTTVSDRGDWWTKEVVSSQWAGSALTIRATVSTGWRKIAAPASVKPTATDFGKTLTLQLNPQTGELWLHALLADEKGELEYSQVFRRREERQ